MIDSELDRLETLLADPRFGGNAFGLDALQGFLCAVASAPQPIPVERWLGAAMGTARDWLHDPEAEELVRLLQKFRDDVAAQLVDGDGVTLLLYPVDEGTEEMDYGAWAQGYLEGVDLSDPEWEEAGDPDEVEDMLLPVLMLADGLEEDSELRASLEVPVGEAAALLEESREMLVSAVQSLFDYWAERRRPETVRREAPKVGRNDPCPCGSGRKYKHCCGRD
jgi:uncharacterized protein